MRPDFRHLLPLKISVKQIFNLVIILKGKRTISPRASTCFRSHSIYFPSYQTNIMLASWKIQALSCRFFAWHFFNALFTYEDNIQADANSLLHVCLRNPFFRYLERYKASFVVRQTVTWIKITHCLLSFLIIFQYYFLELSSLLYKMKTKE